MSFYGYDPNNVTEEQRDRVHAAVSEWIYALLDLLPEMPKLLSIEPIGDADQGSEGYEALDENGAHWVIYPELLFIKNTFQMAEGDV